MKFENLSSQIFVRSGAFLDQVNRKLRVLLWIAMTSMFVASCDTESTGDASDKRLRTYHHLRARLEDGDILLRRGMGVISNMIVARLGDTVELSHCGIVVKRNMTEGLEVDADCGARQECLSRKCSREGRIRENCSPENCSREECLRGKCLRKECSPGKCSQSRYLREVGSQGKCSREECMRGNHSQGKCLREECSPRKCSCEKCMRKNHSPGMRMHEECSRGRRSPDFDIIHSLSPFVSTSDGMQICSLEEFVADANPESIIAVRVMNSMRGRITAAARYYLARRVPFDELYDVTDTTAFFCSELPLHILRSRLGLKLAPEASEERIPRFSIFLDTVYFQRIYPEI